MSSRARADEPRPQPPGLPVGRLFLLPLLAFLVAVAIQVGLKTAGLPSTSPLRVLATPAVAAGVVYLGLRPYARAGRIRLAIMVAAGLLLVALAT
ncbi:MAG: hypothetical protein HYY03_03160 [Chloroflexi bacterium]|nr:hypothetical protein [Chloroflexota bacterium]